MHHFCGDGAAGPTWRQLIPSHHSPPARDSGASAHNIRAHGKLGERHGLSPALNVFGHCTVNFNKLFYGSSSNICRSSLDQAPWPCSASSAMPSTLTSFTHCPNSGTDSGSRKPKLGQSLLLFPHLWEEYRGLRLESKGLKWGECQSLRDAEWFERVQVCLHPLILPFSSSLLLQESCSTETSHSAKARPVMERYTLNKGLASNKGLPATSNASMVRVNVICGIQTYAAYFEKKDLSALCNYKWNWLNFSSALFIFTHSCLVKIWKFCGSFVFCLCDCGILKKKPTWNVNDIKRRQQWLSEITLGLPFQQRKNRKFISTFTHRIIYEILQEFCTVQTIFIVIGGKSKVWYIAEKCLCL